MNNKELELHNTGFNELLSNPAYVAVKNHFEAQASIHQDGAIPLEELGKAYIREAAIKHVFRTIELWASGQTDETRDPETEAMLEPELLDDEAMNILTQG